jgi:hypothetical protein
MGLRGLVVGVGGCIISSEGERWVVEVDIKVKTGGLKGSGLVWWVDKPKGTSKLGVVPNPK